MILSDTEQKIILKVYDICYLSLDDEIFIGLLYDITNKNYLWKTIKLMEDKNIIRSFMLGRKKYIVLTSKGKTISKSLNIIRIVK